MQFAFSNWDVLTNSPDGISYYQDWTAADIRESLRKYGQTVQSFTRNASYLRVGDRPVLFRGAVQFLAFYGHWGISPKEVLDLISEAFPERPYWVATGTSEDVYGMLKSWGFDAFTEYLLYGNSWSEVEKTYRDYWASSLTIAKASGLDFWVRPPAVTTTAPFSLRRAIKSSCRRPTIHRALSEARDFADYHREITRGRVLVYAMNEWCEGGVLEPCAPNALHDGDEMLVAFKAAA
jgi:hypothetical protein